MSQTPHVEHHFTGSASVRDVVIGMADKYAVGGLIPLAPHILVDDAPTALKISVAVTLAALAVLGYVKGRFTGARPWKSALQTTLIGGVGGSAAFASARAVGG